MSEDLKTQKLETVEPPKRLVLSFSGGRTSRKMTKLMLDQARREGRETLVLFANTGREDERSLRFVHLCDVHWNFNTVWLEAEVHPEHGKGTTFKVVTYETASRNGEPYEAMIRKYGIPNANYPHCTRELKLNPMSAYLRHIGWERGTYETAVGIRADEIDRTSSKAKENSIIYPLMKWGVKKPAVVSWSVQQPFDLETPEHRGNCVDCWKKSDRKLATIAREDPKVFDFTRRMEREYANAGAGEGERRFFRGNKTVDDIFSIARRNSFVPWTPETEIQLEMDMLDLGGACGESCEVFADETFLEAAE